MNDKPDWTGSRLEVEVGSAAHGGHCVARHEGRVVFVRHALPGETVVVEITEDKGGGFCRGDAVEVRSAAAGRVTPPCPLADPARGTRRCGGCDWQHADGETQLELKSSVVTEQLRRIAGIDHPVEVRALPGGLLRWRSRARTAVDGEGRPGFRVHRSHEVIPITDCPITMEAAVGAVTSRDWSPDSEVEVTQDVDDEVHVTAHTRDPRRGRVKRASQRVQGGEFAREEAVGRSWNVSAHGFWQVHPAAADAFAATVARMAATPFGGTAWDLYAGVGLFASVLAEQVGPAGAVLAVESARSAVRDATANLSDLPQVGFRSGPVEKVLGGRDLGAADPDVVVLDPPRKGAGREVVEAISARRPTRIVHVACDPAALARDVGLFVEQGYRLGEIEAFDAFPMTHHVESLALLERDVDYAE
ncbi:tRNA/tmRNA/rRNA uracil-C5-methylase (TrmA/RlmC/RlmD family) [Saccharopolyspora lacisalsi]|uniref:tRNA/tmRNA/rRNA uracil-C5-methylase (TrmA/RlmC/RlmD family) n=1 Tax=Halosaccharopolyspora lacisalsi TaxID=1000566 RepID=A0A839E455_9PSEU|nr:TRAM domain-containing protein [Halosaccharopolyspora lacisalsi]MBA8825698.1 tRNA/tmRNA/rRNA uracil-C5-methylase (TrmA/RlmC/RlmD family) [Halosaccharopolyspora lacisalsi]